MAALEPVWDAPLQRLLAAGTLDGYALQAHQPDTPGGGDVVAAYGALAGGSDATPLLRQLHAAFHAGAEPAALDVCGQHAVVVQRSASSLYAGAWRRPAHSEGPAAALCRCSALNACCCPHTCPLPAVSRGKEVGLVAIFLPAGILSAVFSRPRLLQEVAPQVEAACDPLRHPGG